MAGGVWGRIILAAAGIALGYVGYLVVDTSERWDLANVFAYPALGFGVVLIVMSAFYDDVRGVIRVPGSWIGVRANDEPDDEDADDEDVDDGSDDDDDESDGEDESGQQARPRLTSAESGTKGPAGGGARASRGRGRGARPRSR